MSKEINPLQTTFMQRGTVRGRVVLLLRVAEVKPFCCKDLFIFEQHLSLSLFFFFFFSIVPHALKGTTYFICFDFSINETSPYAGKF